LAIALGVLGHPNFQLALSAAAAILGVTPQMEILPPYLGVFLIEDNGTGNQKSIRLANGPYMQSEHLMLEQEQQAARPRGQ
jgi:hypothetical protein